MNLQNFGYKHYTVNHSQNFVNLSNFCNTEMIEGMWNVYKRKFRSRYITRRDNLTIYFAEFAFKRKYKDLAFEKINENLKDSRYNIDFKFIKVSFDLKNFVF